MNDTKHLNSTEANKEALHKSIEDVKAGENLVSFDPTDDFTTMSVEELLTTNYGAKGTQEREQAEKIIRELSNNISLTNHLKEIREKSITNITNDAFEKKWNSGITGDKLRSNVNKHIEQYNKEIDEAVERVRNGESVSNEQVMSEMDRILSNTKVLVNWYTNWADEMDIAGFAILDIIEWERIYANILLKKDCFSICIGTNEDIDYNNGEHLLSELEIVEISDVEANTITNLLGNRFGHTQFVQDFNRYGNL